MQKTKREPDFEDFLNIVVRRAEPRRVPLAELGIAWAVISDIQGPPEDEGPDALAAWQVGFHRDMGYDFVNQGVNLSFPAEMLKAADTASDGEGTRHWVDEQKGPIATWEDFEAYPWPRVTPAAFRDLEALARHLPEGMKAVASIPGGPFENLMFLMGFNTFSYALADQPELVAAIAERIGEVLCSVVEHTSSMEWVGAQWINDDLGFRSGTLASPEVLRKLILPIHRRLAEIAHRNGKPVFLHSCGKLDAVMEDLIAEVGIDAKHSFEHVITPVWEAKQQWGERIGLLGGVDMDVLARGSEEEVRAYTRRCLETCMPGGGWALGSGNTIANYIPAGNYLAMLDEGRRWEA